jgi:glutamate-1-semialdehyde 2,1-aminomutase
MVSSPIGDPAITSSAVAADLADRAGRVVPGGVYGHMSTSLLPSHPQFIAAGEGCRMTDVDGREYIDFLCGFGPIVLGRRHRPVERAAAEAAARGECLTGIPPVMVELCELLVDTVAHADWAMLAKNGTDATTMCVTIARAATGRRKILVARGAYHGAAPWCTPGDNGVLAEDRAHLAYFDYNDVASLEQAVAAAGDDLAGVIVCPIRHDSKRAQELADLAFARGVREACTRAGAVLILDDVRAGFRYDVAGSWEPLGVRPDLSAFSKAIANGHPLAAVAGTDALRTAARSIFVTGSFWYSGSAMAAAVATLTELRETDALARIERAGSRLRDGLVGQAARHGFAVTHSGPVQMPLLVFAGDPTFALAERWTGLVAERGVYLHPHHNWFLSAAHTDADIDDALDRTDDAFAALA